MKDEVIIENLYSKKKLENIYDVCNKLFKDKHELFYSKEEVEKMKKEKDKIFL